MANPVPSISCQRPNIVIAMGGRPHVDGHACVEDAEAGEVMVSLTKG